MGGSAKDRNGIVLAKSEEAKRYQIKTAETIWEAKQKCPHLLVVPPHYDEYLKYSKKAQEIYYRYTDQVEPYGLDECWLDVSGSVHLFGDGKVIADELRESFKRELNLSISVGVSFNKVFAKLGSDMKKPDATTCISRESWKEIVWPLEASELIGIGRATKRKLNSRAIFTLGDLAVTDPRVIKNLLGKPGVDLWNYANGRDTSRVRPVDISMPIKSIGNGTTCRFNLKNPEAVWRVLYALAQNVSRRLRKHHLSARSVQISVRASNLIFMQYQSPLPYPSQCAKEIARAGHELFKERYQWDQEVRAVAIRAINLAPQGEPMQISMEYSYRDHLRLDAIEKTMIDIREKFGKESISPASLLNDKNIPSRGLDHVGMPGPVYQ